MIRDVTSSTSEGEAERDSAGEPLSEETGAIEELSRIAEDEVSMTDVAAEGATGVGLELLFDGCRLGDADPGCWKPGIPPEVGAGTTLVAGEVGEARGGEVSSSMGEYVNMGTCWLVSLAVPFSTTPAVLETADEATAEEVGIGLLSARVCSGFDEVGSALESSSVVDFGEGVMKEVENKVFHHTKTCDLFFRLLSYWHSKRCLCLLKESPPHKLCEFLMLANQRTQKEQKLELYPRYYNFFTTQTVHM